MYFKYIIFHKLSLYLRKEYCPKTKETPNLVLYAHNDNYKTKLVLI